uniref:F-box domain-containing protein n=1 Tax=Cannabis sativa TaxID=3483 RepID=A0A803NUI1_CANSA
MALYGEAEMTLSSIGEDRISMLPDALITHILSFLPTDDAVRTCLISNRWKLIWHSIPTLSFSDIDYVSPQNLYKFVNDYLKHRKRGMYYNIPSVITSFKLDMKYCYQTTKSVFLDKWLDFAVKNKVKEIHVCLNSYSEGENNYWLTETVFNAKYLTVLELERLDLNAAYSISLPALKTLSLKFCFFHGDGLSKILIGCPSLEKLQILTCVSIKSIDKLRLESSTLKFLKIENFFNASFDIVPVQVEATNLESLDIRGFFNIQNSYSSVCKAIRNLTLTFYDDDCIEDTSSLNYIISNLPVLENLTLNDCYRLKLKHRLLIKISNQQLKSFNLKNEGSKYESYNHGMSIIIESAPKLESFYYEVATLLVRRNIITDSTCSLCRQAWDSIGHALFGCKYARAVWRATNHHFDWNTAPMMHKGDYLTHLTTLHFVSEMKFIICSCTLWCIWSERNRFVHGQKAKPAAQLASFPNNYMSNYRSAQSKYQPQQNSAPQSSTTTPIVHTPWLPPNYGELKMNVDVAVDSTSNRIGVGAVVRNSEGQVFAALSMPLISNFASHEMKAKTLFHI